MEEETIRGAACGGANFKKAIFNGAILWDHQAWSERDWSEEDYMNQAIAAEYLSQYETNEEDFDNDEYLHHKVDFRKANLTAAQIENTHEKASAIYDDDIRKSLGLPEYEPREIALLEAWLKSL